MNVIILVTAVLGVLFALLAVRRLRRHEFLSASARGVFAALFFAIAGLFGSITLNLYTYQRLTYEQPVATLSFTRMGQEQYQVHLRTEDGRTRLFTLSGDEWQLDARVLKWEGLANLLGLDTQFRLERISGRYQAIERAQTERPSVYSLVDPQGLDVWRVAQDHPNWIPWVDAVYGSATYMPMVHRGQFEVRITQSGLIARPANEAARAAVGGWSE